jgi:DHA1 family bicyclomycin/chloramphenicol resistance-like MFS transporter
MKKTVALIALLAAFPPLSTDMYLAAIPLLVVQWEQPLTTINLTLVCFFLSYCFFLLIYVPLSDRFGRRPPLLAGIILYTCASSLCAIADSVPVLIIARTLQGAGAAAASSITFAICKDLFTGRIRQRIFLQLGVIVAAAPMIAPIIGGWIIELYSWRWIFFLQVLLGIISAIGVFLMEESSKTFNTDSLGRVFKTYLRLMANRTFIFLTIGFAFLGIPFFAFIGCSSDIIISRLGYDEKEFGYFFSFNSFAFMIAPFVFSKLSRYFSLNQLLPVSFTGVFVASLLMTTTLIPLPYRLVVPMWLLTFFFAFGRPPGNNLILEQVEQDAGAASSLMVFFYFMTGSLAMWIISQDWHDKIIVMGWLGTLSATITILFWLGINRFLTVKLP